MQHPVNIQITTSGKVLAVDGDWLDGMYRSAKPDRVMQFPSEMAAKVYARHHFRRPGQSDQEVRSMMEGLSYPDAVTG